MFRSFQAPKRSQDYDYVILTFVPYSTFSREDGRRWQAAAVLSLRIARAPRVLERLLQKEAGGDATERGARAPQRTVRQQGL